MRFKKWLITDACTYSKRAQNKKAGNIKSPSLTSRTCQLISYPRVIMATWALALRIHVVLVFRNIFFTLPSENAEHSPKVSFGLWGSMLWPSRFHSTKACAVHPLWSSNRPGLAIPRSLVTHIAVVYFHFPIYSALLNAFPWTFVSQQCKWTEVLKVFLVLPWKVVCLYECTHNQLHSHALFSFSILPQLLTFSRLCTLLEVRMIRVIVYPSTIFHDSPPLSKYGYVYVCINATGCCLYLYLSVNGYQLHALALCRMKLDLDANTLTLILGSTV